MDDSGRLLLNIYFSNLRLDIITAGYVHVWPEWRDIDYIPDYNKFYFICDGEGWLRIGGREFYPRPGQLFLMPAGILQSYSTTSANTFTKYWCHFTASVGDINLFDLIQVPYFIDVKDTIKMRKLFVELLKNYENPEFTSFLKVKAALLGIIAGFMEGCGGENIHMLTSGAAEKLKDVLVYIDGNLSEDISIDRLAQIAHFHPNYFIRFFKKHMGVSPLQYINRIRIDKAKELLDTTDMTVAEISDCTGIKDIYYFSRLFKEFEGISPTEFRKRRRSP